MDLTEVSIPGDYEPFKQTVVWLTTEEIKVCQFKEEADLLWIVRKVSLLPKLLLQTLTVVCEGKHSLANAVFPWMREVL